MSASKGMRLEAASAERLHLAPGPMRAGTAECRVGVAKIDVSPEGGGKGIHNRSWGAAASDVASGMHKPIYVSAMAFAPADTNTAATDTLVFVTIDLGWLMTPETKELHKLVADKVGLPLDNVLLQLSHTHASVNVSRPLTDPSCPGAQASLAWWATLKEAAASAAQEAIAKLEPSWVTSAEGSCDMAQKRDLWDKAAEGYVTAMDPTTYGQADRTVLGLRVVAQGGERAGTTVATVCNYGAHPTSLGHPSSLISPDWPGSARDQVDAVVGGTCVFMLGACGDTMPTEGHQGDPAVTERDGSKVGLAAAAAIVGLPAPGTQLKYSGPIVSGAVIGQWTPEPLPPAAVRATRVVRSCALSVTVPVRPMETMEAATEFLQRAQAQQDEEQARSDAVSGSGDAGTGLRDAVALVEQARRNIGRIKDFMASERDKVPVWVWQLGDIFIVATSGEPYSAFQEMIRSRAPRGKAVLVAVMTNGSMTPGYILPSASVGCGCYQDKIGLLGQGALEVLVAAVTAKLHEWSYVDAATPSPDQLLSAPPSNL